MQVTAKHAYTLRIEPCFGIGHNLSLICQMTSEDIKHQLNNNLLMNKTFARQIYTHKNWMLTFVVSWQQGPGEDLTDQWCGPLPWCQGAYAPAASPCEQRKSPVLHCVDLHPSQRTCDAYDDHGTIQRYHSGIQRFHHTKWDFALVRAWMSPHIKYKHSFNCSSVFWEGSTS